jgi:hypothetical protein
VNCGWDKGKEGGRRWGKVKTGFGGWHNSRQVSFLHLDFFFKFRGKEGVRFPYLRERLRHAICDRFIASLMNEGDESD